MRQRVLTALLLAVPALLALALRTPWPLATLGLVAAATGGLELGRLTGWKSSPIAACALGTYVASAFVAVVDPGHGVPSRVTAALFLACTLFGVAAAGVRPGRPLHRFISPYAAFWVTSPLAAILLLHRSASGTGLWCLSPALMALVPVWAGDIAAIFAGRAFGKHPLAPKISPKKTVEGGTANLLAAILTAWVLGRLLGLPDARGLGAGLAVGVLGQAGDLFESGLKRRAGVKDSGTLLPGHGGVLDRIDSVLFAAPAVALILLA